MEEFIRRPVGLVSLSALSCALAAPIVYTDTSFTNAATLGTNVFQCTAGTVCIAVTIAFTADTSTVQPFSVTGASGFENLVGTGAVTISFNSQVVSADFLPGQIFVSVDQTNGGAGFGSAFGPTYPLATYLSPAAFGGYGLTTDFSVSGFSPFCPVVAVCDGTPPVLSTTQGGFQISGAVRPTFGFFSSALSTPEPSTLALTGIVLLVFGLASIKRHVHDLECKPFRR